MKGKFKKTVAIVAVSAVTAMTAMFTGCSFVDKIKEEIDHHFGSTETETTCEHVDEDENHLCDECEESVCVIDDGNWDGICDVCDKVSEYATTLANFVENFEKGEYIYEFADIPASETSASQLLGKIIVLEVSGNFCPLLDYGGSDISVDIDTLAISSQLLKSSFDGILLSKISDGKVAVYFCKDFYITDLEYGIDGFEPVLFSNTTLSNMMFFSHIEVGENEYAALFDVSLSINSNN